MIANANQTFRPRLRCASRFARLAPALLLALTLPSAATANTPLAAAAPIANAQKPKSAAPASVPPTAKGEPAPLAKIWRLTVIKQPTRTVINVATLPGLPQHSAFTLRHPDRWVLDFKGSAFSLPRRHWTVATAAIADLRAGQFNPTTVRLVLDLHHPVTPRLQAAAHGLRIIIPDQPAPAAQASAAAQANLAARRQAQRKRQAQAKLQAERQAEAKRHAEAKQKAERLAEAKLAAKRRAALAARRRAAAQLAASRQAAQSAWHPAPAPAHVVPVAAAPAASRPISAPATVADNQPRAATPPRPSAEAAPRPASMSVGAASARPVSQPSDFTPRGVAPQSLKEPLRVAIQGITPGTGKPTVYTGERITLNLKHASLTDFFRLINQISGLNVIVDPSVHGTVTMVLQDVPWDQALDLVLRNYSLARKLEGSVLYITTDKNLVAQAAQEYAYNKAIRLTTPRTVRVIRLRYMKAETLAAIIAAQTFFNKKFEKAVYDKTRNAVILDVFPWHLAMIDSLVDSLDVPEPQVEIRAKIVSASRQFVRELGVQLGFGAGNAANEVGGVNTVGVGQTALNIANPKYATNSGLLPLNVNLGATAPTSGLGFINASSSFRLDAILTAAEQHGLGHILSSPKVITQSGKGAEVQQGVRLPVQTTINNTISVQFFNVTLDLKVTPRISVGGKVYLKVKVENDAIDTGIPPVNGIPAIDTQSATTNVLVANGATVVIGGVMINNNQNTIFQVPFLGSLPVIGNLFKHTVINNQSQELLFFITPTIIGS
jgi:type IV pilus secretin PilQ/predicted competence protein